METKFCSKCKQTKPISEFYKSRKGGCKKCVRAYQNRYHKDHYATPRQKEQLPENHKRCSDCKEVKSLDEFYKDKSQNDGYAHRCKVCSDKGRKERRQREREQNPLYTVSLPEGYKVCRKCIKMLPYSEFNMAYGKLRSRCKQCYSEYKQTEQYKDWQREYQRRPEVKKKIKNNKDRYRSEAKNRAKELAWQAEYNKKPHIRRKNKEYNKRYRILAENREIARQRTIEWRKNNMERQAYQGRVKRARKAAAEGYHTMEQWVILCSFFGDTCPCCGRVVESFEVDHIIPLTWGGSDWLSNLQCLCRTCNTAKGNHRAVDYRPAHVRQWAERETRKMKQAEAAE